MEASLHSTYSNEDGVSLCEHVYTSAFQLNVARRSRVRLGPLAYVTSDIGFGPFKNRRRPGPMEYRMLEGIYRVHRVKKTWYDRTLLHRVKEETFTVLTLQEMDPVKIVADLDSGVVAGTRAVRDDLVFDHRRWMQLCGLTRSKSLLLRSKNETTPRNRLRKMLAISAHIGQLADGSELTSIEMDNKDVFTCYIRYMSRSHINKDTAPRSPVYLTNLSESCLMDCGTPIIIGVPLQTSPVGVRGCVLSTHSDLEGTQLSAKRAFAMVFGDVHFSRTGLDLERPVWCGDYALDGVITPAFGTPEEHVVETAPVTVESNKLTDTLTGDGTLVKMEESETGPADSSMATAWSSNELPDELVDFVMEYCLESYPPNPTASLDKMPDDLFEIVYVS